MSNYLTLLKEFSKVIKHLNTQLDSMYEFEEKVTIVGGSLSPKTLSEIKQLEEIVSMISGLCDAHDIEFEEEVEPLEGYYHET